MEKINIKDLTTHYVIEKLKDTHPLFKYGTPEIYSDSSSRSYDLVSGEKTSYPPTYVTNTQRSKDLLFNYLRQTRENNLAEMTIAYKKKDNLRHQYSSKFNSALSKLIVKYMYKSGKITRELRRIDEMLGSDRINDEMDWIFLSYKRECTINYLFVDSPIENCIRLQAVLNAPTLEEDVDVILNKYIPNLKVAADELRDLYEDSRDKDKDILNAAEYIDEHVEEFREKATTFFNEIDYRSIHGAKIDICDIELDPDLVNLNVSVSKVNDLTQEEYEDPIMSNHVLLKLLRLQYSLERLLDQPFVVQYSKGWRAPELRSDVLTSNACSEVFRHVHDSKYAHTTQKLLYHLNTRLKNSKPKTREREILKTFKSRTAPIIERIKEIHKEVLPYVKTRNKWYLSEELLYELLQDVNTGKHVHTQIVLDKITNAIIETKALCDGYNEEYRRMLDAIAEDL